MGFLVNDVELKHPSHMRRRVSWTPNVMPVLPRFCQGASHQIPEGALGLLALVFVDVTSVVIITPLEQAKEFRSVQTTCSQCSRARTCVGFFR
jgi:hypothetical protein